MIPGRTGRGTRFPGERPGPVARGSPPGANTRKGTWPLPRSPQPPRPLSSRQRCRARITSSAISPSSSPCSTNDGQREPDLLAVLLAHQRDPVLARGLVALERQVEPAVRAGDRDPALVVDRARRRDRWDRRRTSLRPPGSVVLDRRRQSAAVVLHELEAEAALDAEVAARDRMVERRRDLDDLVVLLVQDQVAADAAVRADRLRLRLALLVPGALLAPVELALEHERAGRAHRDAVAAVHARRVGQRVGELGRDPGVEAAAGDGDGERVLPVGAAALDALVTEDALRVVAHVELVVDLRRLVDGGGVLPVRRLVVPGAQPVALARLERRRGRPVALRDRRRTPRSSARRSASPRGRRRRRGTRAPSCG